MPKDLDRTRHVPRTCMVAASHPRQASKSATLQRKLDKAKEVGGRSESCSNHLAASSLRVWHFYISDAMQLCFSDRDDSKPFRDDFWPLRTRVAVAALQTPVAVCERLSPRLVLPSSEWQNLAKQ